jgi:hypothetical protein
MIALMFRRCTCDRSLGRRRGQLAGCWRSLFAGADWWIAAADGGAQTELPLLIGVRSAPLTDKV